jgi:hypothetical protein
MCYLVVGQTGQYGNHRVWWVAVYHTRDQAEQHVIRLNEVVEHISHYDEDRDTKLAEVKAGLDPQCRLGYTGTNYEVEELPLCKHLDEFLGLHE